MRWIVSALAALALSAATAAPVFAAPDDYGELARWGGESATGDAKIGFARGFAADSVDDSVYIVDQQSSSTTTGAATFRLRKFAGLTGVVLGSTTFTVTGPVPEGPPTITSMAVDHEAKHVYITVVAPSASGVTTKTLQQIEVFGTDVTGTAIVAPADVPDHELLAASPGTIGSSVIAVDPSSHDVLVAGLQADGKAPVVKRYRGTADDQSGHVPGDADGSWTGATSPRPARPIGLTVAPDGSALLTVKASLTGLTGASVRRLNADLASTPASPPLLTTQQPSLLIASDPPNRLGSQLAFTPDGSLLAMTEGLWTGYSNDRDQFVDPLRPPGTVETQLGVLRLAIGNDGGGLYDQGLLAGGATAGACVVPYISTSTEGAAAYGVGPGAAGKFFVPTWVAGTTDIEMAVFGPGGEGCDVPAPSLAVSTSEGAVAEDGYAPTGAEMTLDLSGSDLSSLDQGNWSLVEVDWDLDEDATNGDQRDGFEVKTRRPLLADDLLSPAPPMTETVTFDTPGDHVVRARILTTAGVSTIARTVHVGDAPVSPSAVLAGPAVGTTGSAVSFDASGSHVNPAGKTGDVTYEWDFGDGAGFTPGSAVQDHVFGSAGTYSVSVRVTDPENGLTATSDPWTVVVADAPGGGGQQPGGQQPGGDQPGGGGQSQPPAGPLGPVGPVNPPVIKAVTPNLAPRLAVSGSTVTLTLTCPKGIARCTASVVLKAKRGKKTITIGTAKATIAGGAGKKLTVKLNAAGRRALKKAKRLAFTGTVTGSAGGAKRTTNLKGTLKQPKTTKKGKR